jgi:cholesterol transport system auxiliary component
MIRAIPVTLLILVLAGCLGGASGPARQYYVLDAGGAPATPPSPVPVKSSLLVSGAAVDTLYDSDSLVFSRAGGERQYYQFASWTERPARRIAYLAQRRLDARGGFAAVAGLTSGIGGDLMLNIAVVDFYHDATFAPGVVRVGLAAELIDTRTRTLLGRRIFVAIAPAASDDARGAVGGFDGATAEALDSLVPWVEATAAGVAKGAR